MRRMHVFFMALGLLGGLAGTALAATTATQSVTCTIAAIDELAVSGNPATLTINDMALTPAVETSTTYAVTTNATAARRITGQLDTAMTGTTTLGINLIAPSVGASAGNVLLTTTPQTLVTGISSVADTSSGITYTFSATAADAPGTQVKTVTLTLTNP